MNFNPALAGKGGSRVDFAAEDGTYGDAVLVDCNGAAVKLKSIGNVVTTYTWDKLRHINLIPEKRPTRRKK